MIDSPTAPIMSKLRLGALPPGSSKPQWRGPPHRAEVAAEEEGEIDKMATCLQTIKAVS